MVWPAQNKKILSWKIVIPREYVTVLSGFYFVEKSLARQLQ